MDASMIGTAIVYIGLPVFALIELTSPGRRLLHVLDLLNDRVESLVIRFVHWVDEKSEDIFDDFELTHLALDLVHHGILTRGAGH